MPITYGQDPLNNKNIRLGVVGAYIAAEDTAYAAASGWTDLGVLEPGSLVCDFPREMFEWKGGIPKAVKVQAVIGTDGMIDFVLGEYTPYGAEVASGAGTMAKTYAATPAPTTVAASGSSTTLVVVASGSAFAAGMYIEVQTSVGLELTYIESKASTNNFNVKPALQGTPVATTGTVKAILQIKQGLGSAQVPRFAFKAVFVDQRGEKVTLYMPAASLPDGYKPQFPDGSNAKLPLRFKAYGKDQTWNGQTEQIVAFIYHDYPNVS